MNSTRRGRGDCARSCACTRKPRLIVGFKCVSNVRRDRIGWCRPRRYTMGGRSLKRLLEPVRRGHVMGNCTGVIYGRVTNPDDGSPISGVRVDLNWVQNAEGGALKIGGNAELTAWVPSGATTSAGEYIIPFFWASEQVPGEWVSAFAIRFYADNSYTSMNRHGHLAVGEDVLKLIAIVAPPIPGSLSSAGSPHGQLLEKKT